MKIEYRQATVTDAELLIEIYNASFYSDYIKYGECPAYGKTEEVMRKSIISYPKFLILCDGDPVGCISCKKIEERVYEVGCLCVIPLLQGKGIGRQAIEDEITCLIQLNRFQFVDLCIVPQDFIRIMTKIKTQRTSTRCTRAGR